MMNTRRQPIQISVETEYLENQSQPDKHRYAFAYHITISNTGSRAAQLIARHWIITDGNQEQQEVHGMGVVGEQPLIHPGDSFQYTSGVVLETPIGTMEGSYQLVNDAKEAFEAPISPFLLSVPNVLH